MDNLKSKLEKAKNALKGANADMKPIYQKQVDTLEAKIKEFKEEPKAIEAVIETNDEIVALTKKLEKAQNALKGAKDEMKPIFQKQIDKLESQIKDSLAGLKKAETVSEVKKVEAKVEKKVQEAKKTEKKVKTSASLINSTFNKIADLGKFIKAEGAKFKKKHTSADKGFIDKIHSYYNDTFASEELKNFSNEQLTALSEKALSYKKEVADIFVNENKAIPRKKPGRKVPEKKEEKATPISEMSHEEKCAELIAKYEEKRKKAKTEKDTRKPATKAKDKTENFVESLYQAIVKLIEKEEITPKAVDTIINRLGELTMQLKALKKKM